MHDEDKKNFLNVVAPTASAVYTAFQKESFGSTFSDISSIAGSFGTIITFIALYFAFKCKTASGGIDIVQVILACCCSPCYLVFRLLNPC